jgi:probable selenium-dependent hydroxylase accessory protein YqeC
MVEDGRWRRLLAPGITAIVGAGGKTTVLERLGVYGHRGNLPILISSTVSMDSSQVDNVEPFDVICTDDMEKGEQFCASRIGEGRVPAWFYGINEENRYIGLPVMLISQLKQRHPEWYILVEADATRNKWLKAPKGGETFIPVNCDTLIGVLNLQMLGHALTGECVDGVENAAAIMGRPEGAIVTPALLAKLIRHPHGMFRDADCRHILFCTGYNAVQHRMTEALMDDLEGMDLAAIVLADGYKDTCAIRQYIDYNLEK